MTTTSGKHAGPRPVDESDWPTWDDVPTVAPAHAAGVWPPPVPAASFAGLGSGTGTATLPHRYAAVPATAWDEDDRDRATDDFLRSIAAEAAPRAGLPSGLVRPERDVAPRRARSHAADTRTSGPALLVIVLLAVLALVGAGVLVWSTLR